MSDLPKCPTHGIKPFVFPHPRRDGWIYVSCPADYGCLTVGAPTREEAERAWTACAIARSKPMKPIILSGTNDNKCPRCDCIYSVSHARHCPECGQPLIP